MHSLCTTSIVQAAERSRLKQEEEAQIEAARLKEEEEAQAASRAETERLKRVEEEEEEAKAVEARRAASETQRTEQVALAQAMEAAEGMTARTAVGTNVFNLSGWDPAGPGQASTSPDVDHERSEEDSQDSFRVVSAPQCVVVGWYQVATKWLVGPCCLPVTLFSP